VNTPLPQGEGVFWRYSIKGANKMSIRTLKESDKYFASFVAKCECGSEFMNAELIECNCCYVCGRSLAKAVITKSRYHHSGMFVEEIYNDIVEIIGTLSHKSVEPFSIIRGKALDKYNWLVASMVLADSDLSTYYKQLNNGIRICKLHSPVFCFACGEPINDTAIRFFGTNSKGDKSEYFIDLKCAGQLKCGLESFISTLKDNL
jgi:hypothetical protein